MSEFPGLFDYKSFVNFSNDLEELTINSDSFLSEKLLLLIEKNFGISNTLISLYDGKKVTGAITYNQTTLLKEPYFRHYYKKDPVSSYISNKLPQISSSSITALKATDIIACKYAESDYCSYLNIADLYYLAVAPVPLHNFRLCFYKSREMTDFSNKELNSISSITSLISKKYNTNRYIKTKKVINLIKNKFLDDSSSGIIILNSNFEIIDYNEAALLLISSITEKTDIYSFFSDYFMHQLDSSSDSINFNNKYYNFPKDISVRFSSYTDLDYLSSLQKYYIMTFSSKNVAALSTTNNSFIQHFKLSQREYEIVELLSQGLKYQEIADQLFISLNTLRTHIKNIYNKLEINNQRTLLALYNKYKHS